MFGKLLTDLRTKSKLVFARPVYVTEIYYERLQDMLIEIRKRLTEAIAAQNLIEEAISKDLASICLASICFAARDSLNLPLDMPDVSVTQ